MLHSSTCNPPLRILAVMILSSSWLSLLVGQQNIFSESDADNEEIFDLPRYLVLGSRLAYDSPIDADSTRTFDSADIDALGFNTPADLITSLPFTPSSGASTSNAWNDNSAQTTANYRGLGNAHNLVLINGRRAALFPQIDGSTLASDIGNLPAAGLLSVSVLTDSAGSIYGSDAAAGVTNIALIGPPSGGRIRIRAGNTLETNVNLIGIEGVWGGTTSRGEWAGAIEYRKRSGLVAGDTRNGYTEDRRPWGGPDLRQSYGWPGQVVLPAGADAPDSLIGVPISIGKVLPDGSVQHGEPSASPSVNDFVPLPAPFSNGKPIVGDSTSLFDRAKYFTVIPEESSYGGWFTSAYKIKDSKDAAEAFGELILRRQELRSTIHPFRVNLPAEDRRGDGLDGAIVFPASNPYNPFNTDLYKVRFSMVEMGPRIRETTSDSIRMLAGLRSNPHSTIQWEGAFGHHRQRALENGTNFTSDTLLQDALSGRLGGWLNPFGPSDDGVIEAMRVPVRVDAITDLSFADFKISGQWHDVFEWLTGFEVRKERVQRIPDELLKTGGHASWSLQEPVDLSRNIKAAFAELSTEPFQNLRLWASIRHDRYDDFGASTRPKIGMNWSPNQNWTFSATWGEAFKAPELMQLYAGQIVFAAVFTDPMLPDIGPYEYSAKSGGNPNLKPELTESTRISTSWQTRDGKRRAGVAYWRYHQKNAVTNIGSRELVERAARGDADALTRVIRAPSGPNGEYGRVLEINDVLGNYAGILTDGADFWVDFNWGKSVGFEWSSRVEGTWLNTWKYLSATGGSSSSEGYVGRPRLKALASLGAKNGPWQGDLSMRYISGQKNTAIHYLGGDPGLDDYCIFNLRIARSFKKEQMTVALLVSDLLNLNTPTTPNNIRGTSASMYPVEGRGIQCTIDYHF